MTTKVFDIQKYEPKASDMFFFDNNVWMYLFCPMGNYNQAKQKAYSQFLKSVRTCKSGIFTSSLILSEFANRNLRMDFEQWKKTEGNHDALFKEDYVGSERYKSTTKEIKRNIDSILQISEKSSDNFSRIDFVKLFTHFENIDFNDSYYIEFLSLNKWKLVSDDNDFVKYTNHSLEVLTLI